MMTAMNSIKEMIDVNTIIGDPIKTVNNTVIIPISKLGFGFAAGGSEFNGETVNTYNRKDKEENINYRLPFGGGSGAGVSITPVAFLIVQNDNVKLLEASHSNVIDKLVEYIPDAMDKIHKLICKKMDDTEDDEEDTTIKKKKTITKDEDENLKIKEEYTVEVEEDKEEL